MPVVLFSPIARYVALAVLVLAILFGFYSCGRKAGIENDRKRSDIVVGQLKNDLSQCRINEGNLDAALKAQNAAVAQLEAEGRDRQEKAAKALQTALRGKQKAEQRAAYLLSHPPTGVDACARMFDADEKVLKGLGQ